MWVRLKSDIWLRVNAFLFGDQRRKWIVVLATVAVTGLLAMNASVSNRLALPVIAVLLVAVFPVVLFFYDRFSATVTRRAKPESALDVLAHEHSVMRATLRDLTDASTTEGRLENLNKFVDGFYQHGLSEEINFFNAL